MKIVQTKAQIAQALDELREKKQKIGFVPTMGALHAGHLSLVTHSKKQTQATVLSVFVNPLQFGPSEDFSRYPRPIEKDIDLAQKAGVDIFFNPSVEEMYPSPQTFHLTDTPMSGVMCGAYRPGHFQGVCTVVLKLLNTVQPYAMFLGKKDAQQLRILHSMAEQLNHPSHIIGCETLREQDGLAMSSRNIYLNAEERQVAPRLYQALSMAHLEYKRGERSSEKIIEKAQQEILKVPQLKLQYLELRNWRNLESVNTVKEDSLIAVAAYLGKTRLIDNIFL